MGGFNAVFGEVIALVMGSEGGASVEVLEK